MATPPTTHPHNTASTGEAHQVVHAVTRRWPTGLGIAATAGATLLLELLPQRLAFLTSAWSVLLAAIIYLTWGAHRGAYSRPGLLRAQTAAVMTFGAIAIAAGAVDHRLGVCILAAGWLGHAAWDVAHHRMNAVVPRWYAETCLVSDLLVAAGLLASLLS
jgi:hypothetical protein